MSSSIQTRIFRKTGVAARPVRLIIRGDDAGVSETANRAIKLACEAGTLRNVSVMACGPAFEEAAAIFRDLPDICLGLHVTLTSEWPDRRWGPISGAARCPSLVQDDGTFHVHPRELQRRGFSLKEAVFEAESQLARLRSAGISPVYLDEHMGIGWLPGLRDALAELAHRHGLHDVDAAAFDRIRRKPDKVCDSAESLMNLAGDAKAGTYLHITHPDFALAHQGRPGGDRDAQVRDADRRLLLSPGLINDLRRAGLELTTFTEAMAQFRPARTPAKAETLSKNE